MADTARKMPARKTMPQGWRLTSVATDTDRAVQAARAMRAANEAAWRAAEARRDAAARDAAYAAAEALSVDSEAVAVCPACGMRGCYSDH